MKLEKQRIAIAEVCEWIHPEFGLLSNGWRDSTGCWHFGSNALNDLNAMHEAEKVLIEMGPSNLFAGHESFAVKYVRQIARLVQNDFCHESAQLHNCFAAVYADAPKRAEAFLRTIGKWEDGE